MPLKPSIDELETLRQLDDTFSLAGSVLSREVCMRLRCAGLASENEGWWRITAMGRRVLAQGNQIGSSAVATQ